MTFALPPPHPVKIFLGFSRTSKLLVLDSNAQARSNQSLKGAATACYKSAGLLHAFHNLVHQICET
jgi:hypothetical protein